MKCIWENVRLGYVRLGYLSKLASISVTTVQKMQNQCNILWHFESVYGWFLQFFTFLLTRTWNIKLNTRKRKCTIHLFLLSFVSTDLHIALYYELAELIYTPRVKCKTNKFKFKIDIYLDPKWKQIKTLSYLITILRHNRLKFSCSRDRSTLKAQNLTKCVTIESLPLCVLFRLHTVAAEKALVW
jgi:hypothetical protein